MATNKDNNIRTLTAYRYTITLDYLDIDKNKVTTRIKNESLKSLIIDHNYDANCMPVMYANLSLDRSLIDDMIKNQNRNLIIITMNKYDKNAEIHYGTLCFRKKFIYFLPDNVNRMDPGDYNENTEEQMKGDTYTSITLGLLALDHVNNNKINSELTVSNVTQYNIVKHLVSHIKDVVIEPFTYNDTWSQLIIPSKNGTSVNKALQYLNNQRVFYSTPYRYYQDYDNTYIISSSGKAIERPNDLYTSIVMTIKDVDDISVNNTGMIINKPNKAYEVYVSYANTQVYDNTLVNKSKTVVQGITSSGTRDIYLPNTASYNNKQKIDKTRLDNDNKHMIENIEAQLNSENFLFYFSKIDLDNNLFTINKRISINNIDRYREFNGEYLLYRKREIYLREDSTFILSSMINLKRISSDSDVIAVETTKLNPSDSSKPNNPYSSSMVAKATNQDAYMRSDGTIFIPAEIKYSKK